MYILCITVICADYMHINVINICVICVSACLLSELKDVFVSGKTLNLEL